MYGMPAREVQRSDQVSDVSQQAESSDLLVNNLSYHQPEALSLAVQRSYSRNFFQRRSYGEGETAVIDFNSGTDYVDPGNSYLTFTVLLTGVNTPTAGWGINSAMNLIKQVTIKSRSGTELDRVERCNLWSGLNAAYTNTRAYLDRQGPMEGWNQAAGVLNRTTAVRYAIPLKRLAPFFNPVKRGQKIPPQCMSGLHMEIIFEDRAIAFLQATGVGTDILGYTVDQLSVMTDNICMTDDVQKTLNDQSANDGLEYAFPRIFTSQDAVASTNINSQVRRAVSQANIAYAISLDTTKNALGFDSFKAITWDATVFQFRLGALYYPIQAIQDPLADAVEPYAQALEMWDKLKHPEVESSVSYADFQTGGRAIMAVSLEKDTALNFSGLPVNNSRVLETLATVSALAARNVVTFLEYSAVVRQYVDNSALSI
jgi:hypothetical protein